MTEQPKFSQIFKYKTLSKYEGLTGTIPCRADTTYVRIEIELEKVKRKFNTLPSSFSATDDGSLKLDGMEFVTIPIKFKYLEKELERLFASIHKPLISNRCSVHVHMNARDFTHDELYTFLLLYMIFERSIYRVSGDRWNNIFCVPLTMSHNSVYASIREIGLGTGLEAISWWKYLGLNISPLWGGESKHRLGTVEFRHLAGTTNIPKIINWINLIVSLKIAAKRIKKDALVEQIRSMNTTSSYYSLAEFVFGSFKSAIIDQPTFKADVEECISVVKFIVFKKEIKATPSSNIHIGDLKCVVS